MKVIVFFDRFHMRHLKSLNKANLEVSGNLMKKLRKSFMNISTLIGLELIFQFIFLIAVIYLLYRKSQLFYSVNVFINIAVVFWVIQKNQEPEYKVAWISLIALFPVFGGLFYLIFSGNRLLPAEKKRMWQMEARIRQFLKRNDHIIDKLKEEDAVSAQMADYIQTYGPYTVYYEQESIYFSTGEEYFERLKAALQSAERFIFMEYYIIDEGKMWGEILEILKTKAKAGVDVRVIYDDMGSFMKLPNFYMKKLASYGIKCCRFNPMIPIISARYNTRDHRKITVVDGLYGFTGGINIADEYINAKEKYGHWKDMGLMIQGEAVWSFTVMFLTMWDYVTNTKTDIKAYQVAAARENDVSTRGITAPYSDNPLDSEHVGKNIYLNLINKAKRYINITTPYLIISNKLLDALCNAAKNGVDVSMITPYKPDKWYVHYVSKSYYKKLVESGVKIYEYAPGFIHGKNFVVDDKYAVVGTINMDFRSLYLHFECGVWMMDTCSVLEVKKDFDNTLSQCLMITQADILRSGSFKRIIGRLLRIFAPLM